MQQANPFTSFCLYVAARVFVQYLKSRPTDNNVKASLHFLLTAMQAMRRKNLLTESLLVQLDIDLQGAGLEESRSLRNRMAKMAGNGPYVNSKKFACPAEKKHGNSSEEHHGFGDNTVMFSKDPPLPQGVRSASGMPSDPTRMPNYPDSIQSPSAYTDSSDGRRFTSMPTRTKTPSTRPSPATVSDEAMDFAFDGTDGLSPNSFVAQSSHTSNSLTPPLFNTEPKNDIGAGKPINLDMSSMSNEEFQAMMNGLATDTMYGTTATQDALQVLLGSGPEESNFTMPNFPPSFPMMEDEQHTGFTPFPSGDISGMSADDMLQFLDPSAVDMGWERGFPAGKVEITK